MSPLIRLHANDNVLVARAPIALGQALPEFGLRMRAQVPAGHKIAARRIAAGEPVQEIRHRDRLRRCATSKPASTCTRTTWRWSSSTATRASARTCARSTTCPKAERATFMGIVRADGRVATRNYIGVLSIGELLGDGRSTRSPSTSRPSGWRRIRTSTASSRSRTSTGCGMEMTGEPM